MINTLVKILLNKKLVVALSKIFLGVQVKGLENIKDLQGKVLFIANHNSFICIFVMGIYSGRVMFYNQSDSRKEVVC